MEKKEILTEVTSIATEDEKTGNKTVLPSPEEIVYKASVSMHIRRKELTQLLGSMSKKATMRVIHSIFELPQENLPVMLKTEEEKKAFVLGQQINMDRFLIMQHYVNKEIENQKAKQQEQNHE